MRILFVAIASSVHTARWINQLADRGWDIHLFSMSFDVHPDLRNVTVHNLWCYRPSGLDKSVRLADPWPFSRGALVARHVAGRLAPMWPQWRLARTIRHLKPDIIHSLEMQKAGYLTLAIRERLGGMFPPWIMSIWGSDIYLFGRLSEHIEKIKAVLAACDYFGCECQRDEKLARALGFEGESLIRLPMWGGLDTQSVRQFRQPGPTSARRLIALKGYQGWAGRSLVGLRAIELSADVLKDYCVAIYSAGEDIKIAAELVSQSTGIPIEIITRSSHEEMLQLHGRARISIGLSISDGLPASMIEAMAMGSFPIQSDTSCASEWVQDGKTGLLVHPENPESIAAAVRLAVTDDAMVDRADEINARLLAAHLDRSVIQPQVLAMYERVLVQGKQRLPSAESGKCFGDSNI